MTIKPEEGDSPPEIGQKRRKMNIQSEFKPINTLTRNISGNHSQRPFSGPTSFHGGDSDVETAYATPSRNVLKHPIVNKIVGSGKATSTIHGQGVRSFRTDMRESRTRPNAQGEEPASSCLKSHIDKPMVKQPRQNKIKDANRYGTSKNSMVPASKSSLHSIKKPVPQKGPKKLYASKTNDLTRSKISKKDVLGTRIDPGSPQAYL
jgi:hypothetical protein